MSFPDATRRDFALSGMPENARLKEKQWEEPGMRAAASSNRPATEPGNCPGLLSGINPINIVGSKLDVEKFPFKHGKLVEDCVEFIHVNLNEKITLEDLATVCGCDKFQVIRRFRQVLGTTPHAYIVETRVHRAAQLLKSGEPAAEVASEVGFVDQSHLIRYFKRHVGTTPKRFVYER